MPSPLAILARTYGKRLSHLGGGARVVACGAVHVGPHRLTKLASDIGCSIEEVRAACDAARESYLRKHATEPNQEIDQ